MRVLGLLFAALGVVLIALDLVRAGGQWRLLSVGEYWAMIHRNSLQLAEPAVARHVSPALWYDVILPYVLTPPAAYVAFVVAALFLLLGGLVMAGRRS